MKSEELIEKFKEPGDSICRAALIEYQDERGIALEIGENLSKDWLSTDIIVFWEGGEQTILPDEFELLIEDLWYPQVAGLLWRH